MATQCTIQNFLGIRSAVIPLLEGPTAIVGPNSAGKSSAALAIGGILIGDSNPLGLTRSKMYLHDGADTGCVSLTVDGTEAQRWILGEDGIRRWPSALERLTPHAAALVQFSGKMNPSQRSQLWEKLFMPRSDALMGMLKEALEIAIADQSVIDDVQDQVRIAEKWTDVEAVFKAKALEAKRQWSSVTGESYGVKKAPHWTPAGWRSTLDGLTPVGARDLVDQAREALRAVQIRDAVDASTKETALKSAESLKTLEADVKLLEQAKNDREERFYALDKEVRATVSKGKGCRQRYDVHVALEPQPEDGRPCPSCGKMLVTDDDGELHPQEDETLFKSRQARWNDRLMEMSNELAELRKQATAQKKEALTARAAMERARSDYSIGIGKLRAAQSAARYLESRVVTEADRAKTTLAEQALHDAEEQAGMVEAKAKAHAFHASTNHYASVAQVLGPKGVRGQAIRESMDSLTRNLQALAQSTGWPKVEIDRSYATLIGGRPAPVCSASEQWRAQFVLQTVVAIMKKDYAVIADGADILDPANWVAFVDCCDWLWSAHGISVIVCATGLDSANIPDAWKATTIKNGQSM